MSFPACSICLRELEVSSGFVTKINKRAKRLVSSVTAKRIVKIREIEVGGRGGVGHAKKKALSDVDGGFC